MSGERLRYSGDLHSDSTIRSHTLLETLVRGQSWTIYGVQRAFDLSYQQARKDLKLLEYLYDLDTRRDGRTKVWSWPLKRGRYL